MQEINNTKKISLITVRNILNQFKDLKKSINCRKFFKNSQNDIFLGISALVIRRLAKDFWQMKLSDVLKLMQSVVHEERSLANAILGLKFRKGNEIEKAKIFNFYIKNRRYIRDWNGVDDSAPYIVGPYLLNRDKKLLYKLVISKSIWDRRIAIVSTWWFIRNNKIKETFKIAKILFKDDEDLIHKATGWMLREVGKRNVEALKNFLNLHYKIMPRTTLRYAIERLPKIERQFYLIKK